MTKKQLKMMYILMPFLAGGAIWVNSDFIFGKPSGANSQAQTPAVTSSPTPAVDSAPVAAQTAPAISAPAQTSGPGKTVQETKLFSTADRSGDARNPFLTLKEQFPNAPEEGKDPDKEWTPPPAAAQVIFIPKKGPPIAVIEGRRVKEGDEIYGGKIVAIEKNQVTVEMKDRFRWLIPLGASAEHSKDSSKEKKDEKP